jgi:hypothetical protein
MRNLLLAFLACTALPAAATPIMYDLEYQVTTVDLPSPIYGTVNLGDTIHVNLAWDWDVSLGDPDADNRTASYAFAKYNTSFGNLYFSQGGSGNPWLFRTSFTDHALLEDLETSCQFAAGPAAGTTCGQNALFVDELDFNFQCADWAGKTHVLTSLDCAAGLTGTFAVPIKDFSNGYDVFPGDRDGVMIGTLRHITNVPEPDSMALFAGAMVGAMFVRRRKARGRLSP